MALSEENLFESNILMIFIERGRHSCWNDTCDGIGDIPKSYNNSLIKSVKFNLQRSMDIWKVIILIWLKAGD